MSINMSTTNLSALPNDMLMEMSVYINLPTLIRFMSSSTDLQTSLSKVLETRLIQYEPITDDESNIFSNVIKTMFGCFFRSTKKSGRSSDIKTMTIQLVNKDLTIECVKTIKSVYFQIQLPHLSIRIDYIKETQFIIKSERFGHTEVQNGDTQTCARELFEILSYNRDLLKKQYAELTNYTLTRTLNEKNYTDFPVLDLDFFTSYDTSRSILLDYGRILYELEKQISQSTERIVTLQNHIKLNNLTGLNLKSIPEYFTGIQINAFNSAKFQEALKLLLPPPIPQIEQSLVEPRVPMEGGKWKITKHVIHMNNGKTKYIYKNVDNGQTALKYNKTYRIFKKTNK